MRKLNESIFDGVPVERFIYDNQEVSENEYELGLLEVARNVEGTAVAYKMRKQEIDMLAESIKGVMAKKREQFDEFKNMLKHACEVNGPMKTDFASIQLHERDVDEVEITDFDKVCECYPEAVTYVTIDNKRTVTINKRDLAKMTEDDDIKAGFKVTRKRISYPVVRVKGRRSDEVTYEEN